MIQDGWIGVDLFFILSGFILMHVHREDFASISGMALVRFARLRFFRIYPISAVTLCMIVALVAADPGFASWYRDLAPGNLSTIAFIKTAFLATRLAPPFVGSWNEPIWSVSAEIIGYAAFPFVAWGLSKCMSVRVSLSISSGTFSVLWMLTWYFEKADYNDVGGWSLVRMTCCFFGGAALCRARFLMDQKDRRWPALVSMLAFAAVVPVCILPHGKLFTPAVFAVLIYSLSFSNGPISDVLSSRPAVLLGRISFPLYLIHFMPLMWMRYEFSINHTGSYYALAIYIAACLSFAYVLHRFIEVPAARLAHLPRSVPTQSAGFTIPQSIASSR